MAQQKGRNGHDLSMHNRGLLLKLIATRRCSSRIELSRATRLTRMTVTNVISEFIERDIVLSDITEKTFTVGRNPISITISPNAPKVIGLSIRYNRCSAILCDLSLNELKRVELSVCSADFSELFETALGAIRTVSANETRIVGVGMSSFGPMYSADGATLNIPDTHALQNDVFNALAEQLPYKILLENDDRCAALAESMFGNGSDFSDFIFLGISNGIGCGIILNGSVLNSGTVLATAAGHMTIDKNGPKCHCGSRGCVELYANTDAVRKKLCKVSGLDLDFKSFCELSNNAECDAVFDDMIEALAAAIVNLVNVCNPQAVILGDEGVFLSARHMKKLSSLINSAAITSEAAGVKLLKSKFMQDSRLFGSACFMLNAFFETQLFFEADNPHN